MSNDSETGVRMSCNRVGCKYKWNYEGSSKFWATCPRCKGSVKVNSEVKK